MSVKFFVLYNTATGEKSWKKSKNMNHYGANGK